MDDHRQSTCEQLWRQLLDAPSPDRPARLEAELVRSILRLSLSQADQARVTGRGTPSEAELRGWGREIRRQEPRPPPAARLPVDERAA
ncbi:MAG: hypothetical protein JWM47_2610 [Acidimicrobiales bacterium]|nr:hypothetical protein [Acidimicrobiales bacterium]